MNDRKEMVPFEKLKKLTSLTCKEKEVMIKRFEGGDKTLEEVGRDYRVTRERIKEIERKAFRKRNRKPPEPPDEAAQRAKKKK